MKCLTFSFSLLKQRQISDKINNKSNKIGFNFLSRKESGISTWIMNGRSPLRYCWRNPKVSSQLMRICGQSELGKSQELMPNFRNSQIDFIYIDGSHKATDVLIDAINSWQAIREGGLLIFDDYEWSLHMPETERPKIAIDAFLEVFTGEYCLLHKDYQIIIQKSTYSEGEVYDCCMAESR